MIAWLERLLGRRCCTEWTQWETKQSNFSRVPLSMDEKVRAGWVDEITYTRRWQERRCTICGKIQQRELEF